MILNWIRPSLAAAAGIANYQLNNLFNTLKGDPDLSSPCCSYEIKRHLLLGRKVMTNLLLLLLLSCFSCVRLCATPEMAAHQVPPPLEFSRQEHWTGTNLDSIKK